MVATLPFEGIVALARGLATLTKDLLPSSNRLFTYPSLLQAWDAPRAQQCTDARRPSAVEAALSLPSAGVGQNVLALLSILTGNLAVFISSDALERLPHGQDVMLGLASLPAFDQFVAFTQVVGLVSGLAGGALQVLRAALYILHAIMWVIYAWNMRVPPKLTLEYRELMRRLYGRAWRAVDMAADGVVRLIVGVRFCLTSLSLVLPGSVSMDTLMWSLLLREGGLLVTIVKAAWRIRRQRSRARRLLAAHPRDLKSQKMAPDLVEYTEPHFQLEVEDLSLPLFPPSLDHDMTRLRDGFNQLRRVGGAKKREDIIAAAEVLGRAKQSARDVQQDMLSQLVVLSLDTIACVCYIFPLSTYFVAPDEKSVRRYLWGYPGHKPVQRYVTLTVDLTWTVQSALKLCRPYWTLRTTTTTTDTHSTTTAVNQTAGDGDVCVDADAPTANSGARGGGQGHGKGQVKQKKHRGGDGSLIQVGLGGVHGAVDAVGSLVPHNRQPVVGADATGKQRKKARRPRKAKVE